jgi:tol-pal system protein YbgF
MAGRSRRALFGTFLALAVGSALPAAAQEARPLPAPAPQVQNQPPAGKADDAQTTAAVPGDEDLRRRVEQLEEQLVDLQVVIGTLESLARRSPAAAMDAGAGGGALVSGLSGSDQARLDGLETQIRALTAQIEQLSNDMHGQGSVQRRSDAEGAPDAGAVPPGGGPAADRFGSTTVTSSSSDPIGSMLAEDKAGGQDAAHPRVAVTEPMPDTATANPKQLYEMAYGYLLQQNYGSAQAGFSDFLKRYPKDQLAPNALYWLGETHYVQRNYADAAEAFDLVMASYGESAKAPDASLKRAMSLAQLGKKKEACTAFRDLGSRYPNAPVHVKSKAESESARTGCQ